MYIAHFLTIIFIIVMYLHFFSFVRSMSIQSLIGELVLCAWSLKFINDFCAFKQCRSCSPLFSIRESVTSGAVWFFIRKKKRVGLLCLRCTHRWSVTFIYCFNWVTVLFHFERCWNGGIFRICFHSRINAIPNRHSYRSVRIWSQFSVDRARVHTHTRILVPKKTKINFFHFGCAHSTRKRRRECVTFFESI